MLLFLFLLAMMSASESPFSYDVLLIILENLHHGTLYTCALVNNEFNKVASKLLYTSIIVSPPFQRVLNLKDRDGIPVNLFDLECMEMFLMIVGLLESKLVVLFCTASKCGSCP
jgi:hypothetical protein